ncbi:MAG TPA: NUDIX domain-containing protein, partial [Thermoanaerobaculia bacterium]|nr:NUDIX domain-containing protein [Thermoanaerobaculia bacterium]
LARAHALLPVDRPGDATAALMDLGQLICTPSRPVCPSCPIRRHCQAYRRGRPEAYPQRSAPTRQVRVVLAAVFAGRRGRALLVRRESGFLKGLWEFPCAEGRSSAAARQGLAKRVRPLSLRVASARPAGRVRHTVVNRQIRVEVFPGEPNPGSRSPNLGPAVRWMRPAELSRAAIPTLTRKIARAVGFLD